MKGRIRMARLVKMQCRKKQYSLKKIADMMYTEFSTAQEACRVIQTDEKVLLLCYEQFYTRNWSGTSLTIMITEEEEMQNATVVVSGGGSTLLLKDRGASEELAEATGKALEKCDFERVR